MGDQIYASVVMSGPDMNTSIHRPERCLPAQGWTIADSRTATLPTTNGSLKVTRLHNIRAMRGDRGEQVTINSINYYWFVGHSDTTASHFQRTWIDIRDRLLNGRNQQWAYVTVVGIVTKDFKIFGRTEKQTDELLRGFLKDFVSPRQTASQEPRAEIQDPPSLWSSP